MYMHGQFLQAPVGLSISVTIRVGNELGAGQPQRAKRAAYTGVLVASKYQEIYSVYNVIAFLPVCTATLTVIFLQSTRTVIGSIFTREQYVLFCHARIHSLSYLMCFSP